MWYSPSFSFMTLPLIQSFFTIVVIALAWKFVKPYFHPHERAEGRGPPPSPRNYFTNAHDFIIENFVAHTINYTQTEDARRADEYERCKKAEEDERWRWADDGGSRQFLWLIDVTQYSRAALKKLLTRAMPSAMLYSEERAYAPRCDEGTRLSLRNRVVQWGQSDGEVQRLLWLSGPAAIGKSAVAQTVAEELKNVALLGAAFFFSRANNQEDPSVVIPTLVYQLAALLPEYKLIIGQRYKEDPLIFNKDRRSQFEELICDPFLPDLSHQPLTLVSYLSERLLTSLRHRPLLIVLDGLDECKGRDAQCEFVKMIAHHAQRDQDSRLRWMICSRPESHLKVAFSSEDCQGVFRHEKLEVDDSEAQKDALHILQTGFNDIKKRYPYQLNHDWPDQDRVGFIADQALGHLGFASSIIRFIGDQDYDNPSGQLEVCLKFLERSSNSGGPNPLRALDLLYTQIMIGVQKDALPITQRVLGLLIMYGNEWLSTIVHADFLGLDRKDFYRSLQRLHSVISVPPPHEACHKPIHIYHTSFPDYLMDAARAGEFVLDERAVHLEVACRLSHFCKNPPGDVVSRMQTAKSTQLLICKGTLSESTWPLSSGMRIVVDALCDFCHGACLRIPRRFLVSLEPSLEGSIIDSIDSKWSGKIPDFLFSYLLLLLSEREPDESSTIKALKKIAQKVPLGAILGPEDHAYVPRCREDTRQSLCGRLSAWLQETKTIQPLLWIFGPAGVGKSAVAQTLVKDAKAQGHVRVASFFFQRNLGSDPDVVIPSLIYQMALLLPSYRLIVVQRFEEDPFIFGKSRCSQFKELISDPFLPDLSHRPFTFLSYLSEQLLASLFHHPLLIVLDGLNECNSRDAQREFVEMIARHGQRDRYSRLRWMLCSRPEPHLTLAFSSAESQGISRHERLEIDNDEAQKDVLCFLRKGFEDIRKRYPDQLAHDWPHLSYIDFIAEQASGVFVLASTIIRFIGDRQYDDPSLRFRICLRILESIDPSDHLSPLHSLDTFYTQILSDIPTTTLPTTQLILGLLILYGDERHTVPVHANFLGLDQATFYHSLQCLHSVVTVPPASEANTTPIRIHHASFYDYLMNRARAGRFYLDEGAVHLYVARRGLEWLSHCCKEPSDLQALPELTWPLGPTLSHNQSVLDSVCEFAFTSCSRAFSQLPKAPLSALIQESKNFNFNVAYSKWEDEMREFTLFLQSLVSSDA
ncbi:hypothetical protein D9756_006695 [Leucocoprinus leucothites]|uniref:Nephrocystin 3-like N-terminal domain-containing protein n=1 Tax=Leucocoprinus leucothites TaxID=201217 RepID=A0A8H5G2C0_9AGAR|nr:hypothetical protein D9756_006695 [Leucoagaricus leucothites]